MPAHASVGQDRPTFPHSHIYCLPHEAEYVRPGPAAASAIFAGLQIGIVLALIGAVVGEFVASEKGLGYLIGSATVNMSVSTMFAGVVLLAVLGMAGSALMRAIHRRVVFWEETRDGAAGSEV